MYSYRNPILQEETLQSFEPISEAATAVINTEYYNQKNQKLGAHHSYQLILPTWKK